MGMPNAVVTFGASRRLPRLPLQRTSNAGVPLDGAMWFGDAISGQ
jgi:hypothetical protein